MIDNLPEKFVKNMQELFAKAEMESEFSDFISGFNDKWKRAWRLQKDKANPKDIAKLFAAESDGTYTAEEFLQKVPWSKDGYYIPGDARPGRSLAYVLGLIYIQEASAMLPAEVSNVKPGEKVLDLCAAPGGKSSQVASKLKGDGLLVSNDISESRARVLAGNIELQGYRNTLVTHFDVNRGLPQEWYQYFDVILLDVPCSGEGMFRRDNQAIASWADYGPESIREIQLQLINDAAELLKPGGRLIYSTCTFNTWENEELIVDFISKHQEFDILEPREYLASTEGTSKGIVVDADYPDLEKAIRIWPQNNFGEGHFCIALHKAETATQGLGDKAWKKVSKKKKVGANKEKVKTEISINKALEALASFLDVNVKPEFREQILSDNKNSYYMLDERLFLLPEEYPDLDGLHLIKSACYLGDIKNKGKRLIFNPTRDLLLQNEVDIWQNNLEIDIEDNRLSDLISGATYILSESEKEKLEGVKDQSYIALSVKGLPLTWTKLNGSTLKNLFPQKLVR